MAERRAVSNPLALTVLAYLSRGPMHPYELSRTLRDHGDARSVKFTHGSLYMVVRQLEKAGFVAPQQSTREGQRPERTPYAITDSGLAELVDWLRELVEQPRHEYPDFVAALSLIGALPPDKVVRLLGNRLRGLAAQRAEIQQLIDGTDVHPLFLIEEEYRLAMLDAEVAFVEGFVARITDPVDGWQKPWAAFHYGTSEGAPE
ncbi:MAG: PadR family transcriptional regulator [Micromonosporaceae bacterium]